MMSVITGHETFKKDSTPLRYDLIAPNDSTLVILMGMTSLQHIATQLVAHGRSPSTPVCIISWGTYPRQQTVTGTLADIVERSEKAHLAPPAVIVVGEVVQFRTQFLRYGDLCGEE